MSDLLYITHDVPTPKDGSLTRSYHFIKHLSNLGYHIDLLSLKSEPNPEFESELRRWCDNILFSDIPQIQLGKSTKHQMAHVFSNLFHPANISGDYGPFLSSIYSVDFQNMVIQYLNSHFTTKIIASILPLINYIPSQWGNSTTLDIMDAKFREIETLLAEEIDIWTTLKAKKQLYFYDKWSKRALDKGIRRWIAVSDTDAEQLRKKYPRASVASVPNGVNCGYFKDKSEYNEENHLVFVGNMGYSQNVRAIKWFMDSVWPDLLHEVNDIKFTIVGRSPTEYIQSLSSVDSITVTGEVPDIRPYLWKGTVGIAPMVASAGLLNKILESLACGLPVVSTQEGVQGMQEDLKEQVLVSKNSNDFTAHLLCLLSNPSCRESYRVSGRKAVVKHASWEARAEEFAAEVEFDSDRKPKQ